LELFDKDASFGMKHFQMQGTGSCGGAAAEECGVCETKHSGFWFGQKKTDLANSLIP